MENEMEIVMRQLTDEIEEQKNLKEEAVHCIRQDMERSMHDLKVKYQVMSSKVTQLRSVFSGLVQSYYKLRKDAQKFPEVISSTVKHVKQEVSQFVLGTGQYLLGIWDRCILNFQCKKSLCPIFGEIGKL